MALGKKLSTITAIMTLLNDIYSYINNNKDPIIIFLDFKKAFDTISHKKKREKCTRWGTYDRTLAWFQSYLSGRKQCVIMNSTISTVLPLTHGVPQGSILGPILVSMYINEIPSLLNCGIVLYADDTVIYHDTMHALQQNLNIISDRCENNMLTINVIKSQWMHMKIHRFADYFNLSKLEIKNNTLEEVKTYKYLGVHIDNQLTFQYHHQLLIRNVNFKVVY